MIMMCIDQEYLMIKHTYDGWEYGYDVIANLYTYVKSRGEPSRNVDFKKL